MSVWLHFLCVWQADRQTGCSRVIKVAFISSFSSHVHLLAVNPWNRESHKLKMWHLCANYLSAQAKKWLLWVFRIHSEELYIAFSIYMVVLFGWKKMPILEAGISPKPAILPRLDRILGFISGSDSTIWRVASLDFKEEDEISIYVYTYIDVYLATGK